MESTAGIAPVVNFWLRKAREKHKERWSFLET